MAILNSLNAYYFPIFEQILMILVSKFMVQTALPDKTYFSLGLLSPLKVLSVIRVDYNNEMSFNVAGEDPGYVKRGSDMLILSHFF